MIRRSREAGATAAYGAAAGRSDADLVASAQAGDTDALEQLLRRHQDRVHALCRRITGDEDAGLDATQEALISIARGIARFDGRSSFATWAYRVATNAALDEVRRRKRRPVLLAGDFDSAAGATESGTRGMWPGSRSGADADMSDLGAAVSERLDLDKALSSIPEEQRVAIVLRDLLDLDYAAIAEVLHVPVGTVKSRIARGRGTLAGLIAGPVSGERAGGNRMLPAERQNEGETSGMRG
jgi:RNA polymerase sigma-70 factor (ECF subfamily)